MKRVWSGASLHDTAHLKNLLEHAGIGCTIKNSVLGGALGDLPFLDASPELWVLDDRLAERATTLLRDALRPAARDRARSWRCPSCGEDNEAQFGACWRCGRGDPAADATE